MPRRLMRREANRATVDAQACLFCTEPLARTSASCRSSAGTAVVYTQRVSTGLFATDPTILRYIGQKIRNIEKAVVSGPQPQRQLARLAQLNFPSKEWTQDHRTPGATRVNFNRALSRCRTRCGRM